MVMVMAATSSKMDCDDEVEVICISSGCPDLGDLEKEEQVQVNGPG